MSLIERYQDWFEYEADAHAKTLAAIDSIAASERRVDYQTALDLFAHMMMCRRLWLHRLGVIASGPETDGEIFPAGSTRQSLDEALAAMIADWLPYMARLDHEEIGRRFVYASMEGDRYTNSVEDVLTQLFGHAWHHRGQIMAIVARCGGEPQAADLIFWTRRRVAGD